ncbi:MAG: hypothetical protein PHD43_13600 [Methylococcales bacterium]|nr:hypothetical protein [Methylococcales bacterium]
MWLWETDKTSIIKLNYGKVKKEAYNCSEACKKKDKRRKLKEVPMGIPKWKAGKNQKTAHDRRN